jgi:uncharacterized protein YacL
MSRSLKRKLLIIVVFLIFSALNYLSGGSEVVFLYAAVLAIMTILLESMFYSKRGLFLYSLLGLIAGFYSGKLIYELFSDMMPSLFKNQIGPIAEQIKPYFILAFSYLGFILPTLSSTRYGGYALNFPFVGETEKKNDDVKLIDTSVIIDGRIADIAETGFICGTLILPKFVLNEIQALADSKDPIKRSRARRGLDVLNRLKEIQTLDLKIFSKDYMDLKGVDAKLIALAKELSASIITNDYNLNKVAKLDSIQILNLNDLANSMKPVLLPGEEMELDVIKEGKENNQGVGYLPDGTMVVVANGINYIGRKINVKVTSILQTSAGRIIFTEPKR